MNERAVIGIAVAVGAAAIGGLFLVARHVGSLAPKVLGVSVVPAKEDAYALVEVDVAPSPGLSRLGREGGSWEYRVAEPDGRTYVAAPSSDEHTRRLMVPYAYGRAPRHPQIEVWIEGERRAATPIPTMPPPVVASLPPQAGASIRAFHLTDAETRERVQYDTEQRGGVRFAPDRPIPTQERWIVQVLQTPLQPRAFVAPTEYATYPAPLSTGPNGSSGHPEPAVASLFYADDVTAVRVRVRRILHHARSERIRLSGLRLVKRKGQTAVVWGGTMVPNALGLDIHKDPKGQGFIDIDPKTMAPGTVVADLDGDRREPYLSLVVIDPIEVQRRTQRPGPSLGTFSDPYARVGSRITAIDSADLERLHVRDLGIEGGMWRAKGKVAGVVSTEPFDAVLTVTREWDEELGSFEATIPVEPAR